ncbi:hypothetical protein HY990_06480 [Candidatus Micrarchaeota archaeon]|nr:hypothetical protein [Candidatus Micrarchaeota archaeon]
MKGQSSMEFFLTFATIAAFSIPVLLLLYSLSTVGSEDSAKNQADATVRSLSDTMNLVYSQGAGAQRSILLNLPPTTSSLSVQSGEVSLRIKTSNGYFDSVSPTIAKVRGTSISDRSGLLPVSVMNRDGIVELVVLE